MKYISLLLLAGCSFSSITELEDQYFQCTSDDAQGCNLIAGEIDRRYEIIAKREQRELAICDRPAVTCVSGAQANEFFRIMGR